MNNFTKDINEGFQKATNELISLRIVCSNKLAVLLDEFEKTYHEMMLLQPQMLDEIKRAITPESYITGQFDFETPSKVQIVALGESLVKTKNEIIQTMRQELGVES